LFERFTPRARQVVVFAHDEACALKHNYIGTEHILLGLLREQEGLAARVLGSLDITLEAVREQVARIIGQGEEATAGEIPFTPRAKKVLELSLREAMSLKHHYLGTEHILLGLARENEGVAARILLDLGADAPTIRSEVMRMFSGRPPLGATPTPRPSRLEPPAWEYRVEHVKGLDVPEAWLNELGAEGWELHALVPVGDGYRAVFGRARR
jgi:ATP-dependent Clp protease ATP-binding subunit ClpA